MKRVRSYDLATGDVEWESKGLTMNPIPSLVHADGLVFLMAGFRGNDLEAVRIADAKGDIDAPRPSRGRSNSGILSAFDAKTGKPLFQNQRLEGVPNVFASPVSAGGRVYIPGQDGVTVVFKAGPAVAVIATSQLDDAFDALPALVDNELFLRGRKFLYAIAAP
jgi:outer membrane protein assembly factor BamB